MQEKDRKAIENLEKHIEIPKVNIYFTKNSKDLKIMMQLQASCATKDDQKSAKLKECALIAQVKAIVYMVSILTLKKSSIMENHNVFALFMIQKNQMPTEVVQKYLKFW